jgi:hypothetical protein
MKHRSFQTKGVNMRLTRSGFNGIVAAVVLVVVVLIFSQALIAQAAPTANHADVKSTSATIIDPDIIDSEWNHHLAGYILISIALLVLVSQSSSRLAFLRALWPFLFIAAGLYLLAWSDKEIWPRGFLSWTWLIHHDAEARQHKIYGILLLIMGGIEYLRWRGKLKVWGQTWSFPILALIGACLLLVHDHGGNSGLAPGWDNAQKAARIAEMERAAGRDMATVRLGAPKASEPTMSMPAGHHDMAGMVMSPNDGEGKRSADAASNPGGGHGGHIMTSAMLHVKAEHLWFTLIGIAIALFKFIDDGSFWRKRFVPYLWPSGMLALGTLLALYTETM